jgi:bifunctional non-homologous end joining protein LigD
VLRRSAFIVPASPVLRDRPPDGDAWLHEVKFDGWRIQLHKHDHGATIYTKNGNDFTRRWPAIAAAVAALPIRSAIIDGELTACDACGLPDFTALHNHARDEELCVWAFDVLQLNGADLRAMPLTVRKYALEKLVYKNRDNCLRYSETFDDGAKLLASCERMGLEGIVSKKRDASYRSGKCDWTKVKCLSWREANKDRGDLFNRDRRAYRGRE